MYSDFTSSVDYAYDFLPLGLPGLRGAPGPQGAPGFCEFCNYAGSNYLQAVAARPGGNTKGP
jgi:collagen type IX alpha